MVPCSPEVIDIGPGIVSVCIQVLTLVAMVYGLNRNHVAIKNGSNGHAVEAGKNGGGANAIP